MTAKWWPMRHDTTAIEGGGKLPGTAMHFAPQRGDDRRFALASMSYRASATNTALDRS